MQGDIARSDLLDGIISHHPCCERILMKASPATVRFDSGVFVVGLGEELSHLQEGVLSDLEFLSQLAQSIDPPRLAIEMSHVKYLGSAAIGKFVDISKTLRERGGTIGLLNANAFCQSVISLARLEPLLPTVERLEEM